MTEKLNECWSYIDIIKHWISLQVSGPSDAALISSTSYFMLIVQRSAKRLVRGCKKISSCSCLTVPPGPAWVLLSKIYKPFSLSLYVPHNTSFVSGPVFGLTYRWILGQTLVTSSFHTLASGCATDVQVLLRETRRWRERERAQHNMVLPMTWKGPG